MVDVAAKLPTAVICEMMGIPKADWDLMFKVANMSIGSQDPEYQIEGDVRATGRKAQMNCFNYFVNLVNERRNNPVPTQNSEREENARVLPMGLVT